MEAVTSAIATLVALEARVHELVSPVESIADAVKAVVKEVAIELGNLHGQVQELKALQEQQAELASRVAALEAHPAVSIPALEVAPLAAAAPSAPAVDVASEVHDTSSDTSSAPAAAPAPDAALAGAPDLLSTFQFDKPEAPAGNAG